MWKLKDSSVQIVSKRLPVVINAQKLAQNQSLAQLIINDPQLYANYGHNLVWTGEGDPTPSGQTISQDVELVIDVTETVKKTSGHSASTSEVPEDGEDLTEVKQASESEDITQQPTKRSRKKRTSKKRK